jgi:hypothetical protein
MGRRTSRVVSVTLLLIALLAPTSLAGAAPAEIEHWHDVFEQDVVECGLSLHENFDVRGSLVVNTRGRDQLWYGAVRIHGTYTLTNPDDGRTWQLRFAFNDKDLDVRLNDDGTATLTVLRAGRWLWTSSEGWRVLDAGVMFYEVIWDYDADEGTFVREIRSAGNFQSEGRSWCDDVHAALG